MQQQTTNHILNKYHERHKAIRKRIEAAAYRRPNLVHIVANVEKAQSVSQVSKPLVRDIIWLSAKKKLNGRVNAKDPINIMPLFMRQIAMHDISKNCLDQFNVSPHDILSTCRDAYFVFVRYYIMWRIRQETSKNHTQISAFLNRDHTTVLYGIRRIDHMIECGRLNRDGTFNFDPILPRKARKGKTQ